MLGDPVEDFREVRVILDHSGLLDPRVLGRRPRDFQRRDLNPARQPLSVSRFEIPRRLVARRAFRGQCQGRDTAGAIAVVRDCFDQDRNLHGAPAPGHGIATRGSHRRGGCSKTDGLTESEMRDNGVIVRKRGKHIVGLTILDASTR